MKAISVRQPWARLILLGKDIENRTWRTKFRGRVLLHASMGMTYAECRSAMLFARDRGVFLPLDRPLERGGIVGSVEIVDCVTDHPSLWFEGPEGFVLRDPRPLPFTPCKGALGFFTVPDDVLRKVMP